MNPSGGSMEEGGISVEKIEELQLQMQQLQSSIEAAIGYYRGTSYCAVIVSKSLGYFCSL